MCVCLPRFGFKCPSSPHLRSSTLVVHTCTALSEGIHDRHARQTDCTRVGVVLKYQVLTYQQTTTLLAVVASVHAQICPTDTLCDTEIPSTLLELHSAGSCKGSNASTQQFYPAECIPSNVFVPEPQGNGNDTPVVAYTFLATFLWGTGNYVPTLTLYSDDACTDPGDDGPSNVTTWTLRYTNQQRPEDGGRKKTACHRFGLDGPTPGSVKFNVRRY